MELNNTTDSLTLKGLWETTHFEGKQHYEFNAQDELCLKETVWNKAPITVTKLQLNTFKDTLSALQNKYEEIKRDWQQLETEWQASTDKIRLNAKLEKMKDYMLHAKAVGDIVPFLNLIKERLSNIQEQYESNYKTRLELVAKAENLKDNTDFKTTNIAYKELIEAWKTAPPVEKHKLDQLWQRIENARQYFFEKKREHQEDIEKQLLANLDLKLELCEKAEALQNSVDWKLSTDTFKSLTEEWKQIGRVVSPEKNEELWNRFITAQNVFFEGKRKHYESVQVEQEQNDVDKESIIVEIEAIDLGTCNWKDTTDRIAVLSEQWKGIGRSTREKSDVLWERFQEAKNRFFDAKRKHTEQIRLTMEDNVAKKQALINRIEKVKHSKEWREATTEINALMDEWKAIGAIPREVSNELWDTFIKARNFFFERKDADRESRQKQFFAKLDNRILQTQEFLEKLHEEYKEDQDKLQEFEENILTLNDDDSKDVELKKHLSQLINSIDSRLPSKQRKIEEVSSQLAELVKKKEEIDGQTS